MMTREELFDAGVGSLQAVGHYHATAVNHDGQLCKPIQDAAELLSYLVCNAETRRAAMALACAALNVQLVDGGRLFSLNAEGKADGIYISAGAERSIICSALIAD